MLTISGLNKNRNNNFCKAMLNGYAKPQSKLIYTNFADVKTV